MLPGDVPLVLHSVPGRLWFAETETTRAQWAAVMGASPAPSKNEPAWKSAPNYPVVDLTYEEVLSFLRKANALDSVKAAGFACRLPTKEEWVETARTGDRAAPGKEASETGSEQSPDQPDGAFGPGPVARGPANAYGLRDMEGNVSEMTSTFGFSPELLVTCGSSFIDDDDDDDAEEEEIDWSAENTFFKDRKSRFTTGFRICAVRGEAEIAKALDGLRAMTAEEEQMAFQEARRAKLEKMREDREREQSRKREAAERKVREAVSGKTVPGLVADMAAVPGTGFLIGRREVTQAEWFAVTGSPCMIPIDNLDFVAPDLPAICVSLDDCLGFLEKLNATPAAKEAGLVFRLPAPSEWTLACRAGTTGDYCKLPDGTEIGPDDLGRIAWFQDNSGKRPHPVGQKEPNAFGLFDMIGNVEEHTFVDILAEAGIAGFYGGSWMDSADHCMTPSGKSPSGHSVAGRAHRFTSKGFRLAASSSTDAPDVSKRAAPAKAGKKASSGRSGNQIPEKNAARAEKEAATAESERMKRSQRFTAQDAWEVMAVAELLSIAASEETDAARRSEAKALAAAAKDVRARAVALMKGSGTLPDFDENDLVSVKEAARGSARLDPAEALDLLRQTGALKDSCEAFFGTKDRPGADFSALLAKAFSRADKLKEALKSADFDWDEDIACREAVALLEARVTTLSSLPTNGVPEMLLVPFRKNLTRHLSALRDMSAILRKGPPDGIVAKGDFDDLDEPVSEAKQSFREAREMVKEFSGSVPTLRDVIEML